MIVGIDGGGTGTSVLVEHSDGRRERYRLGPFNINGSGSEAVEGLLREILPLVKGADALCIAAAGSSNRRCGELIRPFMEEAQVRRWVLIGDHEAALEGALSGGDGLVLIAGTGSICIGCNGGKVFQAGGWGHLIGDEGSGYAMGRLALSAVAKELDGRGPGTSLTKLLSERLGLSSRSRIIEYVYSGDKSAVAALAPLVDEAAEDGDEVSLKIIAECAEELSALCQAVSEKLSLKGCRAALTGGLLDHETPLRRALSERLLSLSFKPVLPERTGVEGALERARRLKLEEER